MPVKAAGAEIRELFIEMSTHATGGLQGPKCETLKGVPAFLNVPLHHMLHSSMQVTPFGMVAAHEGLFAPHDRHFWVIHE